MKQQPEQKAAAQLKSVTSSPTRPTNRGVTETHSGRRRGTSSPTRRPQQDSESTLTPVKGAPVNEHTHPSHLQQPQPPKTGPSSVSAGVPGSRPIRRPVTRPPRTSPLTVHRKHRHRRMASVQMRGRKGTRRRRVRPLHGRLQETGSQEPQQSFHCAAHGA